MLLLHHLPRGLRFPTSPRVAGGLVAAGLLLLIAACSVYDQVKTYETPRVVAGGYEPRVGDLVFQSLPVNPIVESIEGSTGSPFSHCGVVALDRGRWVVIEAIGDVRETPLTTWIRRGRSGAVAGYRLKTVYQPDIPDFIEACRNYLGRPYDFRYRWDDEAIYCSELIHKAYLDATGHALAPFVKLGDLNWQPYETVIREVDGGNLPLAREMVTPVDVARSDRLELVFVSGYFNAPGDVR